jgi:hypothetical protein
MKRYSNLFKSKSAMSSMSKKFQLRFAGKLDLMTKEGIDKIIASPSNPISKYGSEIHSPVPQSIEDASFGRMQ